MAVRFLKSTTASTLNRTLRPSGYSFPTGLSVASYLQVSTIDYLVVAGGGGGGGAPAHDSGEGEIGRAHV